MSGPIKLFIPNRYDTDRDGDGRPDQWDRRPANPHR